MTQSRTDSLTHNVKAFDTDRPNDHYIIHSLFFGFLGGFMSQNPRNDPDSSDHY